MNIVNELRLEAKNREIQGRLAFLGKAIEARVGQISTLLSHVSSVLLFGIMAIVTYDVLMRYVFNSPLSWSTDVVTMMFVAVVYFGLGYTTLKEGHIRIDFIPNRLSPSRRELVKLVTDSVGFVVLVIFTWQACKLVLWSYETGHVLHAAAHDFRIWMPQVVIPVGLTAFCLQLALMIYKKAMDLRRCRQ